MAQIALAGVGTYLLRISFIALAGRIGTIPPRVEIALGMIPPAVLASIAAQSLLFDDDGLRGLDEWHLAGVAAALVAYRTRNVGATLVTGMALVWILAAVGG